MWSEPIAMFYVYILKSKFDGTYYTGHMQDLEKRIIFHNQGKSSYTRRKMPWELVFVEEKNSRSEAMKRESQIKKYKGGRSFKDLLHGSQFVQEVN
jgi:putative endonuclease